MAKQLIPFKGWYPGYKGAPPKGAGGPVYITQEEYKKLSKPKAVTPAKPEVTTPAKQKVISSIQSQLPGIQQQIGGLQDILGRATKAGYGLGTGRQIPESILGGKIPPPPPPPPPGDGVGVGMGAGVDAGVEAGVGVDTLSKDPKDILIDKLLAAITKTTEGPTLEEQWKTMREEAGVPAMREEVGTFDEEISKTQDLLSDLDARIRRGMGREEARLAPMELITGRQAELQRQAGYERGDVLSTIQTAQRGREAAAGRLREQETDILTMLGLRAQEPGPLETLGTQVGIMSDIQGLYAQQGIDTQVVEAGGRKLLINKQTGATIQDLGATDVAEPDLLSPTEAAALGVPYGTTRQQATQMGITPERWKPEGAEDLLGGLTTDQRNYLNTIQDNARADPDIKQFTDVRAAYEQGMSSAQRKSGAGDITLMRTVAKITDPKSSVREEEFETFKKSQSTLQRFGVAITKEWWSGEKLSDYGRQQLTAILGDLYGQRKRAYDDSWNFYNNQATQAGIPGKMVLPYQIASLRGMVPGDIATYIEQALKENKDYETIRGELTDALQNRELAYQYLDWYVGE